ncbi:MAG: hypothetical protein JZU70_02330 [Chlorobium sp.]|jgi:hypothetical protein|nr:hypothetical protein [Chlorobium sp.]
MAEETKASGQNPQKQGDFVKGDFSTILVGVGALIDSAIEPVSKMLVMTLDSLAVVAKQVLDGVNSTLGGKK